MSPVLLCSLLSVTGHQYLADETRVPGENTDILHGHDLVYVRGKDVTYNSHQELSILCYWNNALVERGHCLIDDDIC